MDASSLVTNLPGHRRMLDVLRDALRTVDEIAVSVSFLRCSGVALFIDELREFCARGGKARILTSTYMNVTQPEALRALRHIEGVAVRLHIAKSNLSASGFHAKFFVFANAGGQVECWVGSSNLSRGGLTTNVEANLRHLGPQAVQSAKETFESLWARDDVVPLDERILGAYATALLEAQLGRQQIAQATIAVLTGAHPAPNEAQRQALAALARLRKVGERRAVIVAAPGVGKTYLAAFDIRAQGARRALFLSHRLEHLTQARKTFESVFGTEKTTGLVYGASAEWNADLVFATVQSAALQLETCIQQDFEYVTVDEFHHAAAPTYRTLLAQLTPDFLLGLTATPERADGHDVIELCDYNVAYEVRLIEAIKRDWLMPFHYFGIADETVDYATIPWRNRRFEPEELENALMLEERVDHILAHAIEKGFDGPRRATAGFCAGVRHARFMAEAMKRRGFSAECLVGSDSLERREELYSRLQDPTDPLEWLFVADLLNEGVDLPALNSLLFLRPTDSATVFLQQLGRGLRLHPDTEVLTVLDFVGHHRNAWLTLDVLNDPSAVTGPSTISELGLTPPRGCEVVLDDITRDILLKVHRHSGSKKQETREAYLRLRRELGYAPFPVDLIARTDVPSLAEFRSAWGSWLQLRCEMGDAAPWEETLAPDDPAFLLLSAVERDWQQPRVYAYALVWAMAAHPANPEAGFEQFYERFPRWRTEYEELAKTKVWQTLEKKLGDLVRERALAEPIRAAFPDDSSLLEHVERRLQYTLEADFRVRHGGVLRRPADLATHERYTRPLIVNHFGLQYDPARHNAGVITFTAADPVPDAIVIITKLDTTGAKKEFQYRNRFSAPETFHWQSQNRQRQDNSSGRLILDHRLTGKTLYLFVQKGSHQPAVYMGPVDVSGVEGNGPMNVTFELHTPLPPQLYRDFAS